MEKKTSMVLAGGVALGAYQAGAYATLYEHPELRPDHLAGASIGAVNAAVIAGGAPERQVERLREFWDGLAIEPSGPLWPEPPERYPWKHAYSWFSILRTRIFGRTGLFRPRLPGLVMRDTVSLYDLTPLREKLERFVDFDRLNGGNIRISVATTDVETGEPVLFDTARGDRIGPDHLLASCGFLPDFPPVEIGGRLLGDGGLSANAPIEAVLPGDAGEHLCFVVDLFCSDGSRPAGLEQAAARRLELILGNQTRERLKALERELRLRSALRRISEKVNGDTDAASLLHGAEAECVTLLHLSYRAPPDEAGPEKPFDFSRASLAERWRSGALDMQTAVRVATVGGRRPGDVVFHSIRRAADS